MSEKTITYEHEAGDEFRKAHTEKLSLLKDINALEKFAIVFEIYDYLKENPQIKKWSLISDGAIGAYVTFITNDNDLICKSDVELNIQTPQHIQINKILNKYIHAGYIPRTVYANNENGMHTMIKEFIGEEYLTRHQQGILNKKISQNTQKQKTHKM